MEEISNVISLPLMLSFLYPWLFVLLDISLWYKWPYVIVMSPYYKISFFPKIITKHMFIND